MATSVGIEWNTCTQVNVAITNEMFCVVDLWVDSFHLHLNLLVYVM